MTLEDLRTMLTEWLTELEPWRGTDGSVNDYILTDEQYERWRFRNVACATPPNRDDILHILLFTSSTQYMISATVDGYLGCIAQSRNHCTGETWLRGNDLPDGKLGRKTWDAIKNGILRYELQSMTSNALDVIRGREGKAYVVEGATIPE